MIYFYRTGYACTQEQTINRFDNPGDWSGSKYCGHKDDVIGAAQRLGGMLSPIQLVIELFATPIFAALADRWSYVFVIAIGYTFAVAGTFLFAVASSTIQNNYDAYDNVSHNGNDLELLMPKGVLIMARIAIGIAGSTLTAPAGALVISYAPVQQRARYLGYLTAARMIPYFCGIFAAVGVVNMYLEGYTTFFLIVATLWVAMFPLLVLLIWGHCCCARASATEIKPDVHPILSMDDFAVDWHGKTRQGKFIGLKAIGNSLCETIKTPGFFRILTGFFFITAGQTGPLSILGSYMQTAHDWPQGRFAVLVPCVGIPAFVLVNIIHYKLTYPRGGFQLMIRTGYTLLVLSNIVLCLVPWVAWLVVLAIILIIGAFSGWLGVLFICVKRFRQAQQAQFQGLFEVFLLLGGIVSIPLFSFVLYDEHADSKPRQALPFFVGLLLSSFGLAIFSQGGSLRKFEDDHSVECVATSSA